MNNERSYHTSTLLSNGKVLVVGGSKFSDVLSSAELYDPITGSWSITGSMNSMRYIHSATNLPNGNVLVAGGGTLNKSLSSAEIYDSVSQSWIKTGSMKDDRYFHTATLLPNGMVLVVGGCYYNLDLNYNLNPISSSELYNYVTGIWSKTGSIRQLRTNHTATLLPNGKVLVAGGWGNNSEQLSSAEIYDPMTGKWSAAAPMNNARSTHTATLLPNGTVLVAGGFSYNSNENDNFLSSAEIYDPSTESWSMTNSLNYPRNCQTSTLLADGEVLFAGGWGPTAELYLSPLPPPNITSHPVSLSVNTGASATFSVNANGTSPSYQWYKDGSPISGATGASHTISNAQASDAGNYTVSVFNSAGSVTSNAATLIVSTPPPPPPVVISPSITSHPSGLNVTAGASASFSVSADGTSPSYQWYKDGSPISGATASSYSIGSAQASDAGNYSVSVFNTAGSVTSNAATLTVGPPPPSITSDLSTVSVPKKKLIPRYTITTNFGAKSFAAKGLPKGLKLNAKNGVISGKPTKPGTYTVRLTAKKMKGKKVEQQATATKVVIVY